MKIGLLTAYFADYGSFYQAVSLYKYLEKQGYDVEIVNESFRYKYSPKLFVSSIAHKVMPKSILKKCCEKVTALNTYCILKSNLKDYNIAPVTFSDKKRYEKYDCVVVGSDEQWSVTNSNMKFIPDCFGKGMHCPHISYATSGITLAPEKVEQQIKQQICDGLNGFDAVAVRDSVTAAWVKDWTDIDAEIVLDPTLLNPFFVCDDTTENKIAVYGEHFSQEQISAIKKFACEHGMQTISIAWKHSWCDTHLNAETAEDVQKAFASASYCVSSTFHGTIFSILAHKPFASFTSELRGIKIKGLLKLLDFEDRLFDINGMMPGMGIDYTKCDEILKKERTKSEQYILKAIETCLHGSVK